jgi:hypothetical protein
MEVRDSSKNRIRKRSHLIRVVVKIICVSIFLLVSKSFLSWLEVIFLRWRQTFDLVVQFYAYQLPIVQFCFSLDIPVKNG